jgi:hypothetical protein
MSRGNDLNWEQMTIDKYAAFQRANGMKLAKVGGIWWAEVRPFFFRPLLPYAEICPNSDKYPLKSRIGGIKHAVPLGQKSNSRMNFFAFDDLQNYSLNRLKDKRRNEINKGIKHFSAKRIEEAEEFINEAYEVYTSFFKKTSYNYLKKRLDKEYFSIWAKRIFDYPEIMVIGAYNNQRLAAISLSYSIENVIIYATYFSNEVGYKLQAGDFMVHTVREAAALTEAEYIFMGMVTGQKSLDDSKRIRGCKLLSQPSYFRINPIILLMAKAFMRKSYDKLIGMI